MRKGFNREKTVFDKVPSCISILKENCMYINFLFRAFATSKIYRELKLRSAILKDKQLKVLPKETLINTLHGVWNLSSDQV